MYSHKFYLAYYFYFLTTIYFSVNTVYIIFGIHFKILKCIQYFKFQILNCIYGPKNTDSIFIYFYSYILKIICNECGITLSWLFYQTSYDGCLCLRKLCSISLLRKIQYQSNFLSLLKHLFKIDSMIELETLHFRIITSI